MTMLEIHYSKRDGSWLLLLPFMGIVFTVYVVIGFALPVLPLHVHQTLGLSEFMVGLVSGGQAAAAIFSRVPAGHYVDSRGGRRAVIVGLLITTFSGLVYLLSVPFIRMPFVSVAILLVGRALLGVGESFMITGSLTLGMARMGYDNTGKVMAWVGTALYAAIAVGAPIGTLFYEKHGFAAFAIAAAMIPILALPIIFRVNAPTQQSRRPTAVGIVGRAVLLPGVAVALAGFGFASITTFIVLLFADHAWTPSWLPLTLLSVAFILGRTGFGHLPDRIGGAKVAMVCMLIEVAGQALIWSAHTSFVALLGTALTGLGFSLVYPALGVEAIRRAPAQSRGLAMGAYTAFLDLSLGVAGPALGLVAGWTNLRAVFLTSAVVALFASVTSALLVTDKAAHGLNEDVNSVSAPAVMRLPDER